MAQYTHLAPTDVQQIATEYGLHNVKSYQLLSGGSTNTNYLVEVEEGKYVFTFCEQKEEDKARELVRLLDYLISCGFSTSKVVRDLSNEPITHWQSKPLMVKEYLDGKIVEDLSDQLLQLIGSAMSQLHQIEAPAYLPQTLSFGKEQFQDVKLYADKSDFHQWLKEIEAYILPYITPDLPKAFIHSDIFFNNVIVSDDESMVTIMDFEEAAYYYRVFDLGMAIIGLCKVEEEIDVDKAKSLLTGYQKVINLTDTEHNALQAFVVYAATSMSFWRHRNFNYTVPTPAMSNHYRALKNVADYVKSLPATFLTD